MSTASLSNVEAPPPSARLRLFRALLWKAWNDAWILLGALVVLNVAFQVIYVWLASQVQLGPLSFLLKSLPSSFEKIAGFPLEVMATPGGRMAMAYIHPVTTMAGAAWAIARGSDCISGEIGRGTMEMLLAQPVKRYGVVVTHGLITTAGALILSALALLGTYMGIIGMGYRDIVSATDYIPSALNLFGHTFFLGAFATFVSAFGSDRRQTVGFLCGFWLVELLFRLVARSVSGFEWLEYFSFFGAYQPEQLVLHPNTVWRDLLKYDAVLIGLGIGSYAGAIIQFNRRDLPAPL